jgi:hypothetical protein
VFTGTPRLNAKEQNHHAERCQNLGRRRQPACLTAQALLAALLRADSLKAFPLGLTASRIAAAEERVHVDLVGDKPDRCRLAIFNLTPQLKAVCSLSSLRRRIHPRADLPGTPSSAQPARSGTGGRSRHRHSPSRKPRQIHLARKVSAQAFSSREPWPLNDWATGSTTNASIAPSLARSASHLGLGIVVATRRLAHHRLQ